MDAGSMFGHVPKALWQQWIDTDDQNRARISCRSILFRVDKKLILFEAGVGAFFSPKMRERYGIEENEHILVQELNEHGINPNDITDIILSHLHFDHVGGLLSPYEDLKSAELVFKNANFWAARRAFERAKVPHTRDKASFIEELPALLEKSGRLKLMEGSGIFPFSQLFSYRESQGHTPGLLMLKVATPRGPLFLPSDLIPGIRWIPLPITTSFDRYPELAIDEKKELLEEIFEEKGTLFLTHDPDFPFAHVEKMGDKFTGRGLNIF